MSAAIYTDIDGIQHQLHNIDHSQITFYNWNNKEQFISSFSGIRIALIQPDYYNLENFKHCCNFFQSCDLVVVRSDELNEKILAIIQEFDLSNFVYCVNGILNKSLRKSKFLSELFWATGTAWSYQNDLVSLCQERLLPFTGKKYKFDVLYGKSRLHRDYTKSWLSKFDQHLWFYQAPYFSAEATNQINTRYNFAESDLWEDEMIPSQTQDYYCTYYNLTLALSQVMPFKIYAKTTYSLVCETSCCNDFSFFTEKIFKPMLGYRLFIVISGQYYLRNLRSFGFKTFDCVINEEYDNILDDKSRWTAALEQAVWLCQQDVGLIMQKIIPIVLHNYDVLKKLHENYHCREIESFLLINGYQKNTHDRQ